jgi:preprotein translocase subunit SecE
MAMNREHRRMAQRQGEVDDEGAQVATKRKQPSQKHKEERTSPGQFVREVRGELRKVVWPSRGEVINYSLIVLVLIIGLTAFIGGLDFIFGEAILRLFKR